MSRIQPKRLQHPAAWTPQSIGGKAGITVDLQRRHVDALQRALHSARHAGADTATLQRSQFPLDSLDNDLQHWRQQLQTGSGIVLLRGLPVHEHPIPDLELMFLGLGTHLGIPVSQSSMGDRVGHVTDVGGKDKRERAYRNSRELSLHTDRCDYIGMLCIRAAREGGISGYASALTLHNKILEQRPELLQPLYEGYCLHRFGEQPAGEPPVTDFRVPVFSQTDGWFNVIYLRGYIQLAVEEGHYTLSDTQREALDLFDQLALDDAVSMRFRLEPGEATLTNNCLLLHNRTAFDDHLEPERKRLLLRLWLMDPQRPAAPEVRRHKGFNGIEPRLHKGTYYAGPS